jgi:hypothetical protein
MLDVTSSSDNQRFAREAHRRCWRIPGCFEAVTILDLWPFSCSEIWWSGGHCHLVHQILSRAVWMSHLRASPHQTALTTRLRRWPKLDMVLLDPARSIMLLCSTVSHLFLLSFSRPLFPLTAGHSPSIPPSPAFIYDSASRKTTWPRRAPTRSGDCGLPFPFRSRLDDSVFIGKKAPATGIRC